MKAFLFKTVLLGAFATLTSTTYAQSSLTEEIQKDLESAQKRLIEQRAAQNQAYIELSKALTDKQQKLIEKRRLAELSRRSVSDQQLYVNNIRKKAYSSSAEANRLSNTLRTFGLQVFTKLLPGSPEDLRFAPIFEKESEDETLLVNRLQVINVALEQVESALGGELLPAEVSDEKSKLIKGQVASFGPAKWFVAHDQSVAGSFHLSKSGQVATLDVSLYSPDTAKQLVSGKKVSQASIDITGGKAKALAELKSGPLELIKKGGAWVYPILLIALISLACALYRSFGLLGIKDKSEQWLSSIENKLSTNDFSSVIAELKSTKHPLYLVLPQVVETLSLSSISIAEEVLYERLIPVRAKLRSLLSFISVTAAVAPLLGLLGTVSGLIKTFSVIAIEGTGEAQSISGGISEALITTLFGLIVAIPSFMIHALLIRKAKGVEQNIERLGLAILNFARKNT